MCEAQDATQDVPQLPAFAVSRVLQHVELPQRLGACALVSRSWRADAHAATTCIEIYGDAHDRLAGLSAWLCKQGNTVESLCMYSYRREWWRNSTAPTFELPLQQLCKLHSLSITHFRIDTAAAAATATAAAAARSQAYGVSGTAAGAGSQAVAASLCALTALTSLQLTDSIVGSTLLAALPNLRSLQLTNVADSAAAAAAPPAAAAIAGFAAALGGLVQLTHLTLGHEGLSDAALVHLSSLQQLQELQLRADHATGKGLAGLPTTLTKLDVSARSIRYSSSSSTPRLQQLTNLQQLVVCFGKEFDPALLSGLVQLRHLELTDTSRSGVAGTAALLAALHELTQLQHLHLQYSMQALAPTSAAYAALTASSQLSHLELSYCQLPLHCALGQYLFAPGQLRPHLTFLRANAELFCCSGDITCMVGCCPGLERLEILYSIQQDCLCIEGLTALQQLQGLISLKISTEGVAEAALVAALTPISTLRVLQLTWLADVPTVFGIWQLTQLTGLTQLKVMTRVDNGAFATDMLLHNQAPEGSPPDVWQQLEEHCCLAAFISNT